VQQRFLCGRGFGNPAQADLASIGRGQLAGQPRSERPDESQHSGLLPWPDDLISPLSSFEVFAQLAEDDGDKVLRQIHAVL
jgi:hypothetical protein